MIKYDKKMMNDIRDKLKNSEKYLSMATNDTVRGIKTDISSDKIGVRKELNVKKKQVTELLNTKLSSKKNLKGIVSISEKYIPAFDKKKGWSGGVAKPGLHFSGKRSSRPRAKSKTGKSMKGKAFKYTFQFKKNKPKQVFYNAFPARMKSGHVGIFIRVGKGIKEIISSSVYDIMQNRDIYNAILEEGTKRFNKNLVKQLERSGV